MVFDSFLDFASFPEREMARLKEQSKAERERRHLERALKRKHEDDEIYEKKVRVEEDHSQVSDVIFIVKMF